MKHRAAMGAYATLFAPSQDRVPPSGVADHEHSGDQVSRVACSRGPATAISQADPSDGDMVIDWRQKSPLSWQFSNLIGYTTRRGMTHRQCSRAS